MKLKKIFDAIHIIMFGCIRIIILEVYVKSREIPVLNDPGMKNDNILDTSIYTLEKRNYYIRMFTTKSIKNSIKIAMLSIKKSSPMETMGYKVIVSETVPIRESIKMMNDKLTKKMVDIILMPPNLDQ